MATRYPKPVVDELVPIHDITVRLRDFQASRARLALTGQPLAIQHIDGLPGVTVPVLDDHTIVQFELK